MTEGVGSIGGARDDPARMLRSRTPLEVEVETQFGRDDPAVLRAAFDACGGAVYGYGRRLLPSNEDAEDLVQQVFVTAWRQRDRYDPTRASLLSWLLGIARHKAIDRLRKLERDRRLVVDEASDTGRSDPSEETTAPPTVCWSPRRSAGCDPSSNRCSSSRSTTI